MGYQALLFCPDEKLARVVNQVFRDLDFTVEPVNEPFSAVKKLMAQRYDAIVVDCENEQNASLLFKSARNSNSNQSSLALALVEGQAGVAKAYRIGANLVLTKPINVEQAKGTLRVARGLLRKNLDSAPAGTTAKSAPPSAESFKAAGQETASVLSAPDTFEIPELESPLPDMAASAEIEPSPVAIPTPEDHITPAAAPTIAAVHQEFAAEPATPASISVAPMKAPVSAHATTPGAAAAPAPAKEAPAPVEKRSMAPEFVGHASVSSAPSTPGHVEAPSFAALGTEEDSGGAGHTKKILIAVAAIFVVAALAYFGWSKFGQKGPSTQPLSVPQSQAVSSSSPAAPQVPVNTPEPARTSSPPATTPHVSKPSATLNSPPASNEETEPEVVVKKSEPPAIVVKSSPAGKKLSVQPEEASPQVPNPLAIEPANDKHISSLVASAPVNLPKAAPTTLKISQGVSQGLLIKKVQPRYPQNALSMRIQGAVQMEATIDREGNVTNLKVTSGDPILARAATEAVHQWRYKPYYLDGDPVEIQTQITVNFKLPN